MSVDRPTVSPAPVPELSTHALHTLRGSIDQPADLVFRPGEAWAILGPNGVGKSTLLDTLAGHLPPRQGEVRLQQRPLSGFSLSTRAQQIAYLPQQDHLEFWGTVLEFLVLGKRLGDAPPSPAACQQALRDWDLSHLAKRPYRQLSGGERQRARLAQLWLQDSPLLLLDEPLTHLDLAHQEWVLQRIRSDCGQGKLVIAVLHELLPIPFGFSHVLLPIAGRWSAHPAARLLQSDLIQAVFACCPPWLTAATSPIEPSSAGTA